MNSKSENKSENRKVEVKNGSRTYNANWVAVQDGASHVEGMINGMPCQIVPDTGVRVLALHKTYLHNLLASFTLLHTHS